MAKGKKSNGKGRKAKVQDKDDAVETRSAGELDLQQIEINDGAFDLHFRSLKSAVEKMKTAKNLYDSCAKAAKKVSPELLDAVKYAIKLEGLDAADVKRELEIKGYALRRSGSPIQLTIHDTLMGDENELAFKRGKDAGADGKANANPYPATSDLAAEYDRGWSAGTGGNLGLTDEETEDAVDDTPARERERTAETIQ